MKGLENHSAVRARGNSLTREEKAKVKADFIAGKITVIKHSDAYLNGFADASALNARNNPYPKDSADHLDYEIGYSRSMEENV
jgi:hypothetical protein